MFERDTDEQLVHRMRRIAAAVGSPAKASDRRRLLVLRSELLAVRDTIAARSRKLADDMRASRAQLGAIAAYSRCAHLARGASKTPTNGKTTGT
jgi:hypothetical protein